MRLSATIYFFKKSEKFWVLSDQALTSGTTFATTIIAARALSVPEFGRFAWVAMAQLLVLALQNALITGPFQVLHAQYPAAKRKPYINALLFLQSSLIIAFLLFSAMAMLFKLSSLKPFASTWWWIVGAITGYLLQDFIRRIFLAEGKAFLAFIIDALNNLAQLIMLAYLFFSNELTFTNCFQVIALTFIPSILLGFYWLDATRFQLDDLINAGQQHWKNGQWLLLTALLQWWSGNIFIVVAGVALGVETVGALRLAQNIFGVLNVLFQAFENYVVPNAARKYKEASNLLPGYLKNVSLKSALLLLPVLILMILFSKQIFTLAGGAQYAGYAFVLQGMSLLYIFIFIGYPIRIAIRVLLLNKVFFVGYLISAVFSFVAAQGFVDTWGMLGVVAGLIINQVLMLSYWLFILQKKKMLLWK